MTLTKPLRRRRAQLWQARLDRLTVRNGELLSRVGALEAKTEMDRLSLARQAGEIQQLRCQLAAAEWRAEVLARMEEAAHAESVLRGDRLRQAGLSVPVLPEVPCG